MKKIFQRNFHFLLLGLYFPLYLYANNVELIDGVFVLRALLIVFVSSILSFFILRFIFRDNDKTAIILFFLTFFFFSYGSIYQLFEQQTSFLRVLGRHRYLAPIYLVLIIFLSRSIIRKPQFWQKLKPMLNLFSILLLIPPLFTIGRYTYKTSFNQNEVISTETQISADNAQSSKPDIYYIILDTYARSDALQVMGINNSDFLHALEERGFYIADCSEGNYLFTSISLTSSLNMDYLPNLSPLFNAENTDETIVDLYLKNNLVRTSLEELGYTTIAFETGYYWSSWKDADIYLAPNRTNADLLMGSKINEYEAMLIHSTGFLAVLDSSSKLFENYLTDLHFPYSNHINRELYLLETMQEIPAWDAPKFVFAHILIPHYPYVFSAEGEILTDPGYWDNPQDRGTPIDADYFLDGYTNQVAFINTQILEVVDSILQRSTNPPIIVIQGDTGVQATYKQAILNAYYFPDGDYSDLYETISPVNSFRVVFNQFFGSDYAYLEDVTYESDYTSPFDFTQLERLTCE